MRLNGRTITVDDEFLATPDGQRYANERGALWPLVLEKAIAQVDGTPVVTVRNPWANAGIERRDGTWVYGDGTPVRFEDPADADRIRLDPNHPGQVSMPVDVFSRNFNDIVVGQPS